MVPQNLINESFPLGGHSKKSVKDQFLHLGDGNYSVTLKILEPYLEITGIPKRSHTADLIMFMEKSFKFKYYNDEYTHYQYVMPCSACKEGDSLSEKLIRCAHKDSFGKRFSHLGTTRRVSGDMFQQSTIDFAGLPYFRLIDTLDNNKNWFFRNDTGVLKLFQEAYEFNLNVPYKSRRKTARNVQQNREWCATKQGVVCNKTGSGVQRNREWCATKQGVAYTNKNTQEYIQEEKQEDIHDKTAFCENNLGDHFSLLAGNTEYPKNYIKRYNLAKIANPNLPVHSKPKSKAVLTLVSNSGGSLRKGLCNPCKTTESPANFDSAINYTGLGFEGNCTDLQLQGKDMAKSSDMGKVRLTSSMQLAKLKPAEVKNLDAYMVQKNAYGEAPEVTGYTLFKLYRDAVVENGLCQFFTSDKSASVKGQALSLSIYKIFCDSYPKTDFPYFLNTVMADWESLKARLKRDNVWKDFSPYPELGWLKWALPHVLTWYNDGIAAAIADQNRESIKKASVNTATKTLQSPESGVASTEAVKNVNTRSVIGYTYLGGFKYDSLGKERRTYEDDWVTAVRDGDFDHVENIKEILMKKAVDFEASSKRVASLLTA